MIAAEKKRQSLKGISFFEAGRASGPALVLLHGAPGSAGEWNLLLERSDLENDFRILSIDRPGYIESRKRSSPDGIAELADFLIEFCGSDCPIHLLGHSYGAAVSIGLYHFAKDKLNFAGLTLAAGVLDAGRSHTRWYHQLLCLPGVGLLLGKSRVLSAREMKGVSKILEAFSNKWGEISVPVSLLHGSDDWVVDFENSSVALASLAKGAAKLDCIEGAGHDIIKSHPSRIAAAAKWVLEASQKGLVSR